MNLHIEEPRAAQSLKACSPTHLWLQEVLTQDAGSAKQLACRAQGAGAKHGKGDTQGQLSTRGWFTNLHVHHHADNTNFSVLHLLQAFPCLPHIVEIPIVMGHKELPQGGDTQADQHSEHSAL